MTPDELKQIIKDNSYFPPKLEVIFDAVDKCFTSQHDGKPIVSGALPLTMLSEEEFAKQRAESPVDKFRSSQFKKGMYAGYLETLDMLQRQ